MTAPLSRRKQMQILRLYFEGHSHDKICDLAQVGKGSVEMVVDRLRTGAYEEFQDVTEEVDMLREVALYVRKFMNGDLEKTHVGAIAWAALNRMGVEPGQVKVFAALFEELAPTDAPKKEFVETALWCDRLRKELGVNILELPRLIETLREKVEALNARLDALQSEVHAAEAKAVSLRTELGFLTEIKDFRKARETEQARSAQAKAEASAALKESGRTVQDLEKFRVFAAGAEARGISVESELFDTLLELTGVLGPRGVREVAELASLLGKEGLSPADGMSLLLGLWSRGFGLRRASAVARALEARGPFSRSLDRLMDLFDQYGTLEAAVAALRSEQQGESRQLDAKRAEIARVDRMISEARSELADVLRQVKEATEVRDRQREAVQEEGERISRETQAMIADREAKLASLDIELRRAEDVTRGAVEEAAVALDTRASVEAVAVELARKKDEVRGLQALLPGLGRNLGTLARKTRELSAPINVAAYVPALVEGSKEALSFFVTAGKAGLLEEWTARQPVLSETAAGWLRDELIKAQGGALVSAEDHERLCGAKDREIATLQAVLDGLAPEIEKEREQWRASLEEAQGKVTDERASRAKALEEKDGQIAKVTAELSSAKNGRIEVDKACRKLQADLALLEKALPSVGETRFESVGKFRDAVAKVLQEDARNEAMNIHRTWKVNEMAAGRLVTVGERDVQVRCPSGHAVPVHVTQKYVAEVVTGTRTGAFLPMLPRPGIAVERCPRCGARMEVTLDQLVG